MDPLVETDEHLVRRAREGDIAAFESIVARYRLPLVALAAARLGSPADAEDVVQEALVQAFFKLHQLRDATALLPWLRRLAERRALARLRGRREEPLAPDEAERAHRARVEAEAPGRVGVLAPLPTPLRQAVLLTCLAGYTSAEAAALLGVREGTVRSRLHRARAILKEDFKMAEHEMDTGSTAERFTYETVDRLLAEARRLAEAGDLEAAGARADQVLELQARELFAGGSGSRLRFDEEAARLSGEAYLARRRRDCEANAAQYGYSLADLDWELAPVDVLGATLGRPTGSGRDLWGVPLSKLAIQLLDARDICRRLQCSPLALHAWVTRGCPVVRCWPFVRYDLERVRQWLNGHGVLDWPKEAEAVIARPLRALLRATHEHTITPEQALKIVDDLDLP
jgi:RNA polymerase sigma-70 factor, ECF subfamily